MKKIESNKAPIPKAWYSQAIKTGKMLFTAGQIHLTADGKLLEGDIKEQTHQVMKNLKCILEEAEFFFKDVVKTTIFIVDMATYSEIIQVYSTYMSEPYPARETVWVKELPLGAKLEISLIAVKN
ncbi:MAG: hypothetical protein COY38_04860 [Candidatus Aenigmarchaeota archaeon CG_4_10_14_0_8_um_filter_37_24]|nr:MAG: hypothetical protein AUJ50_01725 [Candidatus Aenigmarchaeota archaeon CG1_02_38_14]PIZ33907.1 MAG: hypothetical protein COY38_04860 [Candidatus Aenigmarchaeota archaeon CG_4_10_14_0_8_um_filter_37_24]